MEVKSRLCGSCSAQEFSKEKIEYIADTRGSPKERETPSLFAKSYATFGSLVTFSKQQIKVTQWNITASFA